MASIADEKWEPCELQFSVEEDEYNGNMRYRISWLNVYDRVPGAVGNVDAAKAKALDAKFGGQIRALAGNTARNDASTKPKGKPPAPPKGSKKPAPAAAASEPVPWDDDNPKF
jgi:hypothetical protein